MLVVLLLLNKYRSINIYFFIIYMIIKFMRCDGLSEDGLGYYVYYLWVFFIIISTELIFLKFKCIEATLLQAKKNVNQSPFIVGLSIILNCVVFLFFVFLCPVVVASQKKSIKKEIYDLFAIKITKIKYKKSASSVLFVNTFFLGRERNFFG